MTTRKPEPRKPRWASLAHAAEYYDCSVNTMRRYIANGDLPARRVAGKTVKIDLNDVDAMAKLIPSRRSA